MHIINNRSLIHNKTLETKSNCYYMYGKHAVLSALNNPQRRIIKLFCTQPVFNTHKEILIHHKHEIVQEDTLTKMIKLDFNHQGIVAKVHSIFSYNLRELPLDKNNCRLVILDQIMDPQNIGAIIRSAAAFNINGIIMTEHHTPTENAAIAKAASGTLELIKIIKATNLQQIIDILKQQGFWIIGFDSNTSTELDASLLTGKIAMVFGSENAGLRRLTAKNCDYLVKIPITPQVESLNVANAATIAFYLSSLAL